MSELTCPECSNYVPVGDFPVAEGTRVRCSECKKPLVVWVDDSNEWIDASTGERHGRASLALDEDDEDEDEDDDDV